MSRQPHDFAEFLDSRGNRSAKPWSRPAGCYVRCAQTTDFHALRAVTTSVRLGQHGPTERLLAGNRSDKPWNRPARRQVLCAQTTDLRALRASTTTVRPREHGRRNAYFAGIRQPRGRHGHAAERLYCPVICATPVQSWAASRIPPPTDGSRVGRGACSQWRHGDYRKQRGRRRAASRGWTWDGT